ncbi:hypothetical protein PG995_011701 [Apiospora arundinis]
MVCSLSRGGGLRVSCCGNKEFNPGVCPISSICDGPAIGWSEGNVNLTLQEASEFKASLP